MLQKINYFCPCKNNHQKEIDTAMVNSDPKYFDAIIIGGSYAGLSGAMALGRSLRKVLILDSALPCNRQTPEAHNFLTHDGKKPQQIREEATKQVLAYPSVQLQPALAVRARAIGTAFEVETKTGDLYYGQRLLLATGLQDLLPPIAGLAECWGITVLHCPYCHGYEVRGQKTAILANGSFAVHYSKLLRNWTEQLVILTNGAATFDAAQWQQLQQLGISVQESPIRQLQQMDGHLQSVHLEDGSQQELAVAYAHVPFQQHSELPAQLGCTLTASGHIQVDEFQRTSVPGVLAAGDNSSPQRALAVAVAAGMKAGVGINMDLLDLLPPRS